MSHPIKEIVRSALEPYHPRIKSIVERAWKEWRAVAAFRVEQKFGPVLYPRTIANYVFDAIARLAIEEFADDPSVYTVVESQTVKFFFKGNVLARFKKGDEEKLGQNVPTQASLAFVDAEWTLPGLPPETAKVEFIWLTNEIRTQLEHVLVVARDNDLLLWEYEIEPSAAGSGEVIPFPVTAEDKADSDNADLVKPKTSDLKKTEEE